MGKRLIVLLAFVYFIPTIAAAQVATTGKIAGVVNDPSGAAVPNATVTAKSSALMTPRTAHTSSDGAFLFDLLPAGTYEVTVSAKAGLF